MLELAGSGQQPQPQHVQQPLLHSTGAWQAQEVVLVPGGQQVVPAAEAATAAVPMLCEAVAPASKKRKGVMNPAEERACKTSKVC